MSNLLHEYTKWLIDDQWDFGEFGKHEVTNPTEMPREIDQSLIKPNIFSSIVAFNTLVATGSVFPKTAESFYDWIKRIRYDNKYWTSASGASVPFSGLGGWARSNNLRHTAKCLDQYMLHNCFTFTDAAIFHEIISMQLDNGAFPQFAGSKEDIWSTAYFSNLLIRASMSCNLKLTLPGDKDVEQWRNLLDTSLNRAIDWLLYQLNSCNSMWEIASVDSTIITTAMLTEIGGYLSLHRKSQCSAIISSLLQEGATDGSFLYAAFLSFDTLSAQEQSQIIELYKKKNIRATYCPPKDLVEAACLCKLSFFDTEIGELLFYRNLCNGHESLLLNEKAWRHSDYFNWAINQVYNNKYKYDLSRTPIQDMDFWGFVHSAIDNVKYSIEYSRGWEILWNDTTPVKEERVQVYFNQLFNTFCESNKVKVLREVETGRGPVDFTFINQYSNKCLLEMKLAKNPVLKNGDFLAQIYEYAIGANIDSVFLIVIGFCEEDIHIFASVSEKIESFREKYSSIYIQEVFIDASKRAGASKSKINTTSLSQ